MLTPVRTTKLAPLIKYLNGLTARAPLGALEERLRALDITLEDVAEYVRFHEEHYLRNLVCSGEWYHLLVICWRSGQRSPIHNHAESTCGLRILHGTATETKFEMGPCGLVKATLSRDLRTGDVAASQDSDMHQVSNLQVEGQDLMTLHIYSPPLLRMRTYSLTDRSIGEFRPEIFEHSFGSGI
jgi:cysteine dioxygenase